MKKYYKRHHLAPTGTFCNCQENKTIPKEEALMMLNKVTAIYVVIDDLLKKMEH